MFKRGGATVLAAVFFRGLGVTLAGCNTIAGAGEDIQRGGNAIKEEAREHR